MHDKVFLIAPCGINCSLCYAYLRPKNKCPGCRGTNIGKPDTRWRCKIKTCDFFEEDVSSFCFQCKKFPCANLKLLDKRYRTKYHSNLVENLKAIDRLGIEEFLSNEKKKWTCSQCGGTICMHKGSCYTCKTVADWAAEK